tara:strand:- start:8086 stop:8391 length:306 start_codon:yes stop_codon:yes gene_type:complete
MKKYIFLIFFFIFGIFVISIIKNETREIEKNIRNINIKIFNLNAELYEARLDYNYLSSPANISILSEKFFKNELNFYNPKQFSYIKIEEIKNNNKKVELTK